MPYWNKNGLKDHLIRNSRFKTVFNWVSKLRVIGVLMYRVRTGASYDPTQEFMFMSRSRIYIVFY